MPEEKRVTCPFCSLHCADLRLKFDGGWLVDCQPACSLAEQGFQHGLETVSQPGSHADIDLEIAGTNLRESRQPLVVLSGNIENEAASAAVRLARRYSAILACEEDCSGSMLGLSMRSAGYLTGTLGDLREIDLVVACGVDPARSLPRLEQFLRPQGDWAQFNPASPTEDLRWMRLSARGEAVDPPVELVELSTRIDAAVSGVMLFDPRWLEAVPPTEFLLWLQELNRQKRWYGLYLPPSSNSIGIVETLLAETSYPGGMRFCGGKIEYSPRLWQVDRLLGEGSVDLCLVIGQPGPAIMSALAKFKGKTILISPEKPTEGYCAWLDCTRAGIDSAGTVQRLDGVPFPLSPIVHSNRPALPGLLLELAGEVGS